MKLKECSECKQMTYLWKSKPATCKNCWLKISSSKQSKSKNDTNVQGLTKSRPCRIKSVSDKKLVELKLYRQVRDKYLRDNPVCEFPGCSSREVELHHKKSRAYHLCDESVFMSICRTHHRWIHDNDNQAREMGFLLSSINK